MNMISPASSLAKTTSNRLDAMPSQIPVGTNEPWRNPRFGGANALFIYMRVYGKHIDYDALRKESKQLLDTNKEESMFVLKELAARHGFHLEAKKLTVDQLKASAKPILVHMDGETPEEGAFLLVLEMNANTVFLVNGTTATINSVSLEDFRRVWTGVALTRIRDSRKIAAVFLVATLSTFLLVKALFTKTGRTTRIDASPQIIKL